MGAILQSLPKLFYFPFPLEVEPLEAGLEGALPLPFSDGFPVVLGTFFNPLDFAIIMGFKINNRLNIRVCF